MPWADAVITNFQHPPVWVLDLSVKRSVPEAARVVMMFAHSEPFETLSPDAWVDDYVAAVYLRYERRELSWATFLRMAGDESNANGGRRECEYFYETLNAYEASDFAESLERDQRGPCCRTTTMSCGRSGRRFIRFGGGEVNVKGARSFSR
jgi:hypothetical protein